MSFGFGPGQDMQKEYQSNRNKIKKSKSLKEINEDYKGKGSSKQLTFKKKMTPQELELFRRELEEKKRKDTIRTIIILGLVVITALVVVSFLF